MKWNFTQIFLTGDTWSKDEWLNQRIHRKKYLPLRYQAHKIACNQDWYWDILNRFDKKELHSLIVGHLGCLHFLVIWRVLQWSWMYKYLRHADFISFEYKPSLELLDHMLGLLICWRVSIIFSVIVLVYISTNSVQTSVSLYILTSTCYLCSFW